jgi:hypothetical protein
VFTERSTWRVGVAAPQDLAIALFLRDALSLPTGHDWLPPASPPPARVVGELRDPLGVAAAWDDWWDSIVTRTARDDRDSEIWPSDSPELLASMRRQFDQAVRWSNARAKAYQLAVRAQADGWLALQVAAISAAKGVTAHFGLLVSCIPVEGLGSWMLAPDHLLISTQLLADVERYRSTVTAAVDRLVVP